MSTPLEQKMSEAFFVLYVSLYFFVNYNIREYTKLVTSV